MEYKWTNGAKALFPFLCTSIDLAPREKRYLFIRVARRQQLKNPRDPPVVERTLARVLFLAVLEVDDFEILAEGLVVVVFFGSQSIFPIKRIEMRQLIKQIKVKTILKAVKISKSTTSNVTKKSTRAKSSVRSTAGGSRKRKVIEESEEESELDDDVFMNGNDEEEDSDVEYLKMDEEDFIRRVIGEEMRENFDE
ncbi:hypothetical protein PRIPAC_93065 [Pristionchus pacificus]|uniref:Uncharacterized protein n=1 Tax=Pristionchus pacificus TaxID=54126 RepID=A0A2A6BAP3_PRIPA|nr:hypothetical protein PRIPAC_93065 [Pristionchus pacificus]|eukprot:PDM62950.1 hypothetical protein PRIPAC_50165 [Pristionchus pacificus]